jgi:hypothetical protein
VKKIDVSNYNPGVYILRIYINGKEITNKITLKNPHLKMKSLYLQILLLFLCLSAKGQLEPIFNVPSPEIANLGKFGTIPVGNFTGVPDISIPLYDVKTGNYTLHLTASYHLSSVKPDSQPGCLGLGWNLIGGGYITRNVRGIMDEKCGTDGIAHGFYAHSSKMKDITDEDFSNSTLNNTYGDNYYELTADEFSFDFCGYSGNFYYNEDGGWTVVSDQNIKVEFDPTEGKGFINLSQLSKRINTSKWEYATYNNRFFNKFTLITPDGCRYEFGGIDATEYSIPYYSRNSSDLVPTTWRLSKITTIDKRVIDFTYDTSQLMCDLRYVPQYRQAFDTPVTPSNPYSNCMIIKAQNNSDENITVTAVGNYPTGSLQVVYTRNEDNEVTIEFKDRQDKTVLLRKLKNTGSNEDMYDTYYVYDNLGKLSAVLPPLASSGLKKGTISSDLLDAYAYLYEYDNRERLKAKKLPGTDWMRMGYDEADRMVYSQDGEQRKRNNLSFV